MIRKLYPLKFHPIVKERVWGGDALAGRLGRAVPCEEDGRPLLDASLLGESLDIAAIGDNSSEVKEGFLAESDLDDILETYMGDLVGDRMFDYCNLQFPLLIKTLDIEDHLSVQVHPDDEIAFERYYSYGKTEAWYILEASETAEVYLGFKKDTTAEEFYNACKDGTVTELLNVYHPKKGDFFFIEAGTVHSAGGGLVVAEVQQSSEITFRLYDWGRELNPATAREMHLEDAIDCIDYKKFNEEKCVLRTPGTGILAECSQFGITKLDLAGPVKDSTEKTDSFLIFICVEGGALIRLAQTGETFGFSRGESILVPACVEEFSVEPQDGAASVIRVHVPPVDETDDYIV